MSDAGDAEAVESGAGAPRRRRSDAERNLAAVLDAAKAAFAESGVDAPVRDIAARAGVGVGTIYRHFPQRSDLVVAVFRREVDATAAAADRLLAERAPLAALEGWVERFSGFVATKRGLGSALHSGDAAFDPLPAYFASSLGPPLQRLLDAAAENGDVRPGLDGHEVLFAMARLSNTGPSDDPGARTRMLRLLIDGMRFAGA